MEEARLEKDGSLTAVAAFAGVVAVAGSAVIVDTAGAAVGVGSHDAVPKNWS